MKKIDLYIIKKFLFTFFFMMAVIMTIAIVFDISEKIDDFIKRDAPLSGIIFQYYLNFVLYYGNVFSPLLIFISVIFFTSNMASKTEIVAILSSGISFRRLLLPYFIAASLLVVGALYLNHWLLPVANTERIEFTVQYLKNPFKNRDRHIHKQINPGEFIYVSRYNATKKIGTKFSLEKWEDGKRTMVLLSDYCMWDTTKNVWTIQNYMIREIHGTEETVKRGRELDTIMNLAPSDFEQRTYYTERMNYTELTEFIEEEKMKGSDKIPFYLIEMHKRTAMPIATYILTLIGVSMTSRKVRGGIGVHIALGLLICVTYILIQQVTTVYATNAGFSPFWAVWLPNIAFMGLAIYLYFKAPK